MKTSDVSINKKRSCASAGDEAAELLALLKYFSVFKHPLTVEELYKFSSKSTSVISVRYELNKLMSEGHIKQTGDYYLLANEPENSVIKRLEGEKLSRKIMPKAKKTARLIGLFPFVKFVGISGSLSKNYADKNTDYDFFIITANNTLWICRTMLHMLKKMSFLIGRQHRLCMNYFIDEHHLTIAEKNLFVQIELSTLIPVYNKQLYKTFLLRNLKTLPNIQHLNIDFEEACGYNPLFTDKRNRFWKSLNVFLMKLTDSKWRHKWKRRGYPQEDYDLAFKTTPYVSKNHPKNYQKKVLQLI